MISVVVSTLARAAAAGAARRADQRRRAIAAAAARPSGPRSRVAAAAGRGAAPPALAAALVAVPLVLLMLPALGFTTGAPGIDELPSSNPARQNAETIDRAVGPGWEAPFVLVAATEQGPITTQRELALLARWQRRIAAEPGVRAVIGPAPIAAPHARRCARSASRLAPTGPTARRGWTGSGPGLRRAARRGRAAAGGHRRRRRGQRPARRGLRTGRRRGRADRLGARVAPPAGGEEATGAIDRLADGSKRLADGQREVSVGSLTLALGLRSLLPRLRGGELARARKLAARARSRRCRRSLAAAGGRTRRGSSPAPSPPTATKCGGCAKSPSEVNGGLNRLVPGGKRLEAGVGQLARRGRRAQQRAASGSAAAPNGSPAA